MPVKMTDFNEFDYSIKGGSYTWWIVTEGGTIIGEVPTDYGIVLATVYPEYDHTRLNFALNGKYYTRTWPATWAKRTVSRLAREFAHDIAQAVLDAAGGDNP